MKILRKKKTGLKVRLNFKEIIPLLILFLIFSSFLIYSFIPQFVFIKKGVTLKRDLKSPMEIEIIDKEKTEELIKKAEESVPLLYEYDPDVEKNAVKNLDMLFSYLNDWRKGDKTAQEKIFKDLGITFSKEYLTYFSLITDEEFNKIKTKSISLLSYLLRSGIKDEDLLNLDAKMESFLSTQKLDEIEKYYIIKSVKPFIKVNLKINKELTEKRKEEAKKSVKPVIIKIEKGEVIFEKGTTIGDKEIEILKKYGLLFTIKDVPKIIYSIIIAFLLSLLFFIFVNSNIKISQKEIYFLIVILTLALIAGRFVPNPYLIPLPFFAMLSFLFFSFSASTLFILTAYFFYILFFPNQVIFLTLFLLVSLFLSMQAKRIRIMGDFLKIGLVIGIISSVIFVLFSILIKNTESIVINSILLFVNGTFSSIVLAGLVPHVERLLSISTPLGLVELLNISNPLLNEFILKAPGSYQHSINVSTLAQVAADAIGENALLAKVGAYYHDIGKMLRPQFFIENQSPGINPHDSISPSLSALIIISHVKDGVEIAKKHKLPKETIDIIAEHHGTTMVTYFYKKAKELDPKVHEDTFRYPGPLPSSKVSGIIMLADSIEATARSEKLEKKEDFVDLVESTIKTKIEDGQLENSDLSFKEINKIKEAFVRVLMSVYHERISYNEKSGNIRERGKDTNKER